MHLDNYGYHIPCVDRWSPAIGNNALHASTEITEHGFVLAVHGLGESPDWVCSSHVQLILIDKPQKAIINRPAHKAGFDQ
jgi:hypothetical protein